MRHQKHRHRLGRPSASRKALLRNMAIAIFTHERIVTTLPKAKALRRVVEPLITLGKRGDLSARRRALQILPNKKVVQKLFNEVAPQYAERNGGYTRILKITPRHGDAAPMAMMELVGYSEKQQAEAEKAQAGAKKKSKGLRQRLKDKVTKRTKKAAPAALPETTAEKATEGLVEEAAIAEEAKVEPVETEAAEAEEAEEIKEEAPSKAE